MRILSLLAAAIAIISLSACQPTNPYQDQLYQNPVTQAEKDQNAIIAHLVKKGIVDAQRTASGIYYTVAQMGNDTHPTADDYVKVHYKGTLLNDTIFDSSYDRGQPISFSLRSVVSGWTEGIPLFSEGGKGTLYLPSGLAYGERSPSPKIPANSPLVFDVELLKVLNREAYNEEMAVSNMARLKEYLAQTKKKSVEADEIAIQAYLTKNQLKGKVEQTEDGLYYIIENEGEGDARPNIMSNVVRHFKGTTLDGKVVEDSRKINDGEPISQPLMQVMPGQSFGLMKLGKGGKAKLIIPSYMAYADRGMGEEIPPNSCLIYEVELVDFK